jgi:beta-galactosidase
VDATGFDGIAFGADYNPEQWPEEVWAEDIALMQEAGVNMVSVGIFSWALLEPKEGTFEFGWLDRLLDQLHVAGIAVDLATPTVAPPAWFTQKYPQTKPVQRDGSVLGFGGRQHFCPSSSEYLAAAALIARKLGERYGNHPAVAMWHVFNEYGAPIGECYCEASARHFRLWLADKYGSLEELNRSWGTTFWGQLYSSWDQIDVPKLSPNVVNPTQRLDFARFSNDALLACYTNERDVLKSLSDRPVTTNFMTTNCKSINYWQWAKEVDVVANNHYLQAERPDNHIQLSLSADLTRSVADGRPWILMEHSTSGVNWQPRGIAKVAGEMERNSLAHFARGADGLMFFQWRASKFGAEKFHSAMLPHGGTDTRIWREVVQLGADVSKLAELRGSMVESDVAIVWDWESWWAQDLEWRPTQDLNYLERVEAYYEQLWRDHFVSDFVHPEADLSAYPLVVVPALYLTTAAASKNFQSYVEGGGTLVVSYFSGIVDENDAVHDGKYPGALREVLGVTVDEFLPLHENETVVLSDDVRTIEGSVWTENVELAGAETVLSYVSGPAAGKPAVTKHLLGQGTAWYVSTRVTGESLATIIRDAYASAGISARATLPEGIELVRRSKGNSSYAIVINHTQQAHTLPLTGTELLTDSTVPTALTVPAGTVRVLRTH